MLLYRQRERGYLCGGLNKEGELGVLAATKYVFKIKVRCSISDELIPNKERDSLIAAKESSF